MTEDVKARSAEAAQKAEAGGIPGSLFPYVAAEDHWEIDFNDTEQSYEGSALPIWILAGWAIFILWAVVYLIAGLPTAF